MAADLDESRAQCLTHGVEVRCYQADVGAESPSSTPWNAIARDLGARRDRKKAGIVKDSLLIKVKDGVVSGQDEPRPMASRGERKTSRSVSLRTRGSGAQWSNRPGARHHQHLEHFAARQCGQTNYAATKAGVAAMTVVWARNLRAMDSLWRDRPRLHQYRYLSGMRPEILQKV